MLSKKRRIVSNSAVNAKKENTHRKTGVFLLLCYIDLNKLYML